MKVDVIAARSATALRASRGRRCNATAESARNVLALPAVTLHRWPQFALKAIADLAAITSTFNFHLSRSSVTSHSLFFPRQYSGCACDHITQEPNNERRGVSDDLLAGEYGWEVVSVKAAHFAGEDRQGVIHPIQHASQHNQCMSERESRQHDKYPIFHSYSL